MNACAVCGDRGLVKVFYRDDAQPDASFDVAVCQCRAGRIWRNDQNAGHRTVPLSTVWASKHGIDVDRVSPIEQLFEPDELRKLFPVTTGTKATDAELIAAGRTNTPKRPKL